MLDQEVSRDMAEVEALIALHTENACTTVELLSAVLSILRREQSRKAEILLVACMLSEFEQCLGQSCQYPGSSAQYMD